MIVVEIGAGNTGAAAEVERAITYCSPNVVLFVGVAGGMKDVAIGAVVAGSKVYGYESGKESAGFKPRPSVHESNYRLTQRAKAEARNGIWRQRIVGGIPDPPPQAYVGPIAAGEKLVADSRSQTSQLISDAYGDALAIEMEGYGFLHAAYLNQHIAALVVRGISDLLDGKANADRSGSQERASRHASAFCFEVLANLDTCPGEKSSAPNDGPPYAAEFVRIDRTLASYESRFRKIEKALGQRVITDTAPGGPGPVGDRFTAEMNDARDLLRKGHARAARFLLDSLSRHVGSEGFTKDLQLRLETNLGGSALALGEYEAAERHFDAALAIQPGDAKALANRGQIALVRDQAAVGLEYAGKAQSLARNDPHVVSVYLRALDANGRKAEVESLVQENPWMLDDAECAFTLAVLAYEDGRYAEAELLARTAVKQGPNDAQALELLARCIMVPLESGLERNPPLPGKLPDEALSRASEAESLFSQAIQILDNQDNKDLLLVAVANRGMARSLLGQYEDALRDCDRVLAENPNQQLVRLNKGRLLLGIGRPYEASQVLAELEDAHETAWRPVAAAYLATKQPQKALQVLLPLWPAPRAALDRIRIGELLLASYTDLAQPEAAEGIASALESEYPDDAEAAAIAAEWRASQPGQTDRALGLFYGAVAKAADERQRDRINLSLADFYYRQERFAEAADLYGNLAARSDHPVITKRHLLSLFFSGSHREALRLAQKVRAGGPAIQIISAVEAHLLEEAGDPGEAKELLTQLIALEPDSPDHRIGLAYLRYRTGDLEGSKQAVLGIAAEEVKGNAHQLMALARVRAWLDLDGVLELAYRARRLGFGDPDIHQAYVSLVLNRKRDEDAALEVAKVKPGSTVHLESEDGNIKVFTIVEGLDADLHRGELLPSDPVALKLLGLGTGDSVNLKQTDLETVEYRIAKVESQYVFAFQETLLNFSTWFPDVQGPEKLKADAAGIDKMFQMINQREAEAGTVLDLYRSKRITLGMLAQLCGQSLIQTWGALQVGDELRVIASTGDPREIGAEAIALPNAEVLVLELTGLLTITSLQLAPALRRRFKQILAPQFLLDEISDELTLERAGLRSGLRRGGVLYRKGDRYVMEERTFHTEERRRFLEGLADFLKREVHLLPTPDILDLLKQGAENPLGRAALASILLAKDRGAVLYSDDFVLRAVARNTWGVAGAWSQAVIRDLRRSGDITEDEYHRGVIDLVQRNYEFVSVNEQDYLWSLRENGMHVTPALTRALRALESPDCTEDSAIMVAAALLRGVCLETGSPITSQLVLDACVSALKRNRHAGVVLSKLEARLRQILLMHPGALFELIKSIALWKQESELMEKGHRVRRRG